MSVSKSVNALFSLIRNTVAEIPVPNNLLADATIAQEVLTLARKHDLVQLAAYAIIKNSLLPADSPTYAVFYKKYLAVVSKVTQIEHEQAEISRVLEQAEIPHVLLKGSVMRTLYPEGWMRTSSDIDTLVREEDLDRAVEALTGQLHFRVHGKKNYHDICLVSPSGIPLELHFSILENMANLDRCLEKVWENLVPLEGLHYGYRETPEFFLFHHLAHMTYHFMGGGCGIRFFLDLWIITKNLNVSLCSVRALTDTAGITAFVTAAFNLTRHWLEGAPLSETETRMEAYVLKGGSFGSDRARLSIQHETQGGKTHYLLNRVFPPYDSLIILYPWLKKHPYLTPIAHIHRWFSVLTPEKRVRIQKELQTGRTITDEERAFAVKLLSDLELL